MADPSDGHDDYGSHLDASGRLVSIRQVLQDNEFYRAEVGRWTHDEVLVNFGRPFETSYFPLMKREVWSYRYNESNVYHLIFNFYFDDQGILRQTQTTPDPKYDPSQRGRFYQPARTCDRCPRGIAPGGTLVVTALAGVAGICQGLVAGKLQPSRLMVRSIRTPLKKWRASRSGGHQLDAVLVVADVQAPYAECTNQHGSAPSRYRLPICENQSAWGFREIPGPGSRGLVHSGSPLIPSLRSQHSRNRSPRHRNSVV